jgi:hypothetical protein
MDTLIFSNGVLCQKPSLIMIAQNMIMKPFVPMILIVTGKKITVGMVQDLK